MLLKLRYNENSGNHPALHADIMASSHIKLARDRLLACFINGLNNMSSTINQQISFLNNLYKLKNDSGNSVTSQIRTFQKKIARFDGDLNQNAVHGNETAIAERLNELFIMGVDVRSRVRVQ
jgi:hypothetical protein